MKKKVLGKDVVIHQRVDAEWVKVWEGRPNEKREKLGLKKPKKKGRA